MFKTVAAFASGYGGKMVFGIEKDEATVCGLGGIDPLGERDRLAQLVRAIITPAPEAEVRPYNVDGKVLLVPSVGAGASLALRHHAAGQERQAGGVLRPAGCHDFPGHRR